MKQKKTYVLIGIFICLTIIITAQNISDNNWSIVGNNIQLSTDDRQLIPRVDHMAMSGLQVDMIFEWKIDSSGEFSANRVIRWPMLRTIPDNTHASLQYNMSDKNIPLPLIEGKKLSSGQTNHIIIHGMMTIESTHNEGVQISHTIFPSVQSPAIIDLFSLKNNTDHNINVTIPSWINSYLTNLEDGVFGEYIVDEIIQGDGSYVLSPDEKIVYSVVRSGRTSDDPSFYCYPLAELSARNTFINQCENNLVLETPNHVLNTLFNFSKIRATESIFATRGGLMHGPGGYNKYLAAIWANDQAEYVNPFFPFLGINAGNESAMNSYRHFAAYINDEFNPIPSSIIAEGRDYWNGAGDRGDMAMIAYGAARFALTSGNKKWCEELWPLITWCLEYSNRKLNSNGVVASDTDELEGRFPAGEANLSTSSLYYDALVSASYLAQELGLNKDVSSNYLQQANNLKSSIAQYFEAEVEGFETYQYFDGNDVLRSWICIPLTVGILDRSKGTIDALFSPRLWTPDGLLTQAGTQTVWDRSTLYALRGIFAAGYVDEGTDKLIEFSEQRLLGNHVPYVIEAYPEFNQSHLSAESGLYCRIFTEGLFGIRPTGLNSFECKPFLPNDWDNMALRRVSAFGLTWDIGVSRIGDLTQVIVKNLAGEILYIKSLSAGEIHNIVLN